MNTDNLARSTFVLSRETHEQLGYVARRMGVSRSTLVRDILAEPVAVMASWVRSVPEKPTEAEALVLLAGLKADMAEFVHEKADSVGLDLRQGGAK